MSEQPTVFVLLHVDLQEKAVRCTGTVAAYGTHEAAVAGMRESMQEDLAAHYQTEDGEGEDALLKAELFASSGLGRVPATPEEWEQAWQEALGSERVYHIETCPLHLEPLKVEGYDTPLGRLRLG